MNERMKKIDARKREEEFFFCVEFHPFSRNFGFFLFALSRLCLSLNSCWMVCCVCFSRGEHAEVVLVNFQVELFKGFLNKSVCENEREKESFTFCSTQVIKLKYQDLNKERMEWNFSDIHFSPLKHFSLARRSVLKTQGADGEVFDETTREKCEEKVLKSSSEKQR